MSSSRVVVLSGCSRGLGLAIAADLLQAGYTVVGLSRTQSPEYTELMQRHPGTGAFVALDLSDTPSIYALARQVLDTYGPPYGLVNNAAVGSDGVLATFHASDIERVVATNLTGPILLTKYLSRSMLARREGRIVNITSIVARTGFSGLSVYGACKAGLEGFTRSLSREVGKRGITVNNVAPGFMETAMTSTLGKAGLEAVRRRAPLGLATPSDVAPLVTYLLSDAALLITGATMTVDGGSTA